MSLRNAFPTEYRAWCSMKSRCSGREDYSCIHYTLKKIKVCPEWQESFESFLNHVGAKPSPELTLDRIDNDRGYEPGNVRWATRQEQALNRSNSNRYKTDFRKRSVKSVTEIHNKRWSNVWVENDTEGTVVFESKLVATGDTVRTIILPGERIWLCSQTRNA